MSVILVVVGTAHNETDDAVQSVSAAMKRAGYDVLDYALSGSPEAYLRESASAIIEACEPECNPDVR